MEATLTFNLPDDNDDFILASKGKNYWNCLWDLDQWARNKLKYGYTETTPEQVWEELRIIIGEKVCLDEVS